MIADVVSALLPQRDIWKNVEQRPPIYGAQFGQYPMTEDVTFMADQPQTWAQSAGIQPLPEVLPYIDPMFQYQTRRREADRMLSEEERYADVNAQLDKTELKPQPPMLDRETLRELQREFEAGPAPDLSAQAPLDPALVTDLSSRLRMQGPDPQAPLGPINPAWVPNFRMGMF